MKYQINLKQIVKHTPERFRLAATFDAFVEACRQSDRGDLGWFAVKYTNPNALMGFDAKASVLPLLSLPDGGFAALWFDSMKSPAVIHCDSEGELQLVAATWADFLLRMAKRKTNIADLDDREVDPFPKFRGVRGSVAPLTKKKREFNKWLAANHPSAEASGDSDASEQIRRELVRLLQRDLKDDRRSYDRLVGYKTDEDDFTARVSLQVHLTSRSFKIAEASGRPYQASARLRPIFERLVDLLGHPLKKCDVTVCSDGCVFVDGNTCLGNPDLY